MTSLKQRVTDFFWKSRKNLGLDNLKYTYQVLLKNKVVTESNKGTLVEALRSTAEILIWGDQNDSSVFDYFLEKNMQSFFLDILKQEEGYSLSVQILQTLNILFENTHRETSIYYLMSNDHITSIISYPFNFENEENLAYYISFLKTLSMKLNTHTIHLFFNDVKHLSHFPLYTEAIKFFDHPESMVRIAVRTLTLNVFCVNNKDMLDFICMKTASTYFSNLVYFIGNHALQFDRFLKKDASHLTLSKLESLTEGHLDDILYAQDILFLKISRLSEILRNFLLNNLTIPLYIRSLTNSTDSTHPNEILSVHTALFLLTQILLNMEDEVILNTLVSCLINKTPKTIASFYYCAPNSPQRTSRSMAQFIKPNMSVVQTLSSLSLQTKFQSYVPSVERHTDSPIPSLNTPVYDSDTPQDASQSSLLPVTNNIQGIPLRRAHSSKTSNETMPIIHNVSLSIPFEKLSLIDPVNQPSNNTAANPYTALVETTGEATHPLGGADEDPLPPIPQYPVLENSDVSHSEESYPFQFEESPITSPPKLDPSLDPQTPDSLHSIIQSELEPQPQESTLEEEEKPFISLSLHLLNSMPDDRNVLLSSGLLCALFYNKAINPDILTSLVPTPGEPNPSFPLINIILNAIENIFHRDNCSRLLTLEILMHLYSLLRSKYTFKLTDYQVARLESIKEASISQLRLCYSGPQDTMFADTLDIEYTDVLVNKVKLLRVLNDPSILLPPCPTPLSGVELSKRIPCGENEVCRSKIRTFCLIRHLYNSSLRLEEEMLPLVPTKTSVSEKETINLSNSELVYCLLPTKSGQMLKRFIGIRSDEFVLVEAKQEQISKGVVHYIASVKHVTLTEDTDDKLRLHLRIHKPGRATAYLSTSLVFQDSIRCMAAVQALHRATQKFKHQSSVCISKLLSLPAPSCPDTASLTVTQSIMRNFTSQQVSLLATPYQATNPTIQLKKQSLPQDDDFVHVDTSEFISNVSQRATSTTAFLQPEQIFAPSPYTATPPSSPSRLPYEIELTRIQPKSDTLF
eukprot:TRINITY_DN5686_c0_g1_i1.p1 TRINITY_DN5686_c0_g1~~TRINITY_DN5686_c0_g1_i1.p1  ORF type:complete len:1029 (+),score=223.31 TRINITY_DN5686_c0_g1_i1:89-3175(+)